MQLRNAQAVGGQGLTLAR